MSDCGCQLSPVNQEQRRVLWILLGLNLAMFVGSIVTGWLAGSTALLADALDNFADAGVFALSLYAIGKSELQKIRAAFFSGIFQITLGALVILKVVERFWAGETPQWHLMIAMAIVAILVNSYCVILLAKHRDQGVHLQASWIFLNNDVIANAGIVVAGILVQWTNSYLPDLLMGSIITAVEVGGGIKILRGVQTAQQAYLKQLNATKDS